MPPVKKVTPVAKKAPAPVAKAATPAAKTTLLKKAAAPAKKAAAPVKAAPQVTITLKQIAAQLAEGHDLPKKQTEAVSPRPMSVHLVAGSGDRERDATRLSGVRQPEPTCVSDRPHSKKAGWCRSQRPL